MLSNADLAAIADALRVHGAWLISDEIYRELYYGDRPESASSFYERTIVISGLSKSMSMTGWRLGWITGDEAVIKAALVLHGYVTTCASTISQKAALAAWTDEAAEARAGFRKIFAERRQHVLRLIETELNLRAVAPEGAFYTMLDVRRYGTSMQVADAFLEEGVITVPGSAFGSEGNGYLRVSFCADLNVLSEGVKRMQHALKRLSK
jgi:aspartate/methionine/tyrosine aminotransferase